MKRSKFSIASGPGDFMPLVVGGVLLFVSLPAFVLLLLERGEDFGGLDLPLTMILGIGVVLGMAYFINGLQVCCEPGSLLYRIAHGRIFSR